MTGSSSSTVGIGGGGTSGRSGGIGTTGSAAQLLGLNSSRILASLKVATPSLILPPEVGFPRRVPLCVVGVVSGATSSLGLSLTL